MDAVAYSCAIRAAGSLQQSLRHDLEILDDAFSHIGNRSLSVAHTAMTNCKYERTDNRNSSINAFQKCQNIFDWIISKGIAPSEKTMVCYLNHVYDDVVKKCYVFMYSLTRIFCFRWLAYTDCEAIGNKFCGDARS